MQEVAIKEETLFQSSVSGSFGGACFMIFGHPFDTIKVCIEA